VSGVSPGVAAVGVTLTGVGGGAGAGVDGAGSLSDGAPEKKE